MLRFEFPYTGQQRKLFFSGKLIVEWARKYPFLFSKEDIKLAKSQAPKYHYHFYEWLGAVLLYEATGYYSLVEKYDSSKEHPEKNRKFREIVGDEIFKTAMKNSAGIPDLLVYKPDCSDWFFCEIKGPGDKVRKTQLGMRNKLKTLTGKDFYLLELIRID